MARSGRQAARGDAEKWKASPRKTIPRPPEKARGNLAKPGGAHEEDQPFRLLDLPPEIWSKICGMVVADIEVPISLSGSIYEDTFGTMKGLQQPSITLVCKILREEALPIFYSSKRFQFGEASREVGEPLVVKWLKGIGAANGRHLKQLCLTSWCIDVPELYAKLLEPLGFEVRLATENPDEKLYHLRPGTEYTVLRKYEITPVKLAEGAR